MLAEEELDLDELHTLHIEYRGHHAGQERVHWDHRIAAQEYILDKLGTYCSSDFVPQKSSNSSASDQGGDNTECRIHWAERESVHLCRQTVAQEYMLFCGWLTTLGHSGI